jgi:hypothetical protein
LVHLNLVVESILDLTFPKSGMDRNQVQKFIQDVGRKLGDPGTLKLLEEGGKDLETYYSENYLDEDQQVVAPMTGVPSLFMSPAVEGFKRRYAPWMSRLLTEPRPYKELLDYARRENLIAGVFSQYQSQPASHQQGLRASLEAQYGINWQDDLIRRHKVHIEKIKGVYRGSPGEQWLFKAIFQKALLRLGKTVCADTPGDEVQRIGTIDDLVMFVDELSDRGLLITTAPLPGHVKDLWTFISLNFVNPTIQVTTSSEDRIFSLLTVWYLGVRYQRYMDATQDEVWTNTDASGRAAEIVKRFLQKQTAAEWPVGETCETVLEAFRRSAHLILGVESANDVDVAVRNSVAKARLAKLIEVVISPRGIVGGGEQEEQGIL